MVSLVVGLVAVLLGAVCISAGVAVSVVEALRPREVGAFDVKVLTKLGEVVAEILKAFGKLTPAAQLLTVGLALLGVGIWLLTARPF
jgi:hypothetical protein